MSLKIKMLLTTALFALSVGLASAATMKTLLAAGFFT